MWQWKKELSDFGKIYGPIYGDIQTCSHEEECKNAQIPPTSTSRDNSPLGKTPFSTHVVFHGNVGSLGSVGGQNHENVLNSSC